MKKEIIKRCVLGAPLGVTICTVITVIISLIVGDGNYYPVVPALITMCGSEIKAVLLQMVAGLLYGAMSGGVSIIWDMEKWSLLRQSVTHLLIVSLTAMPLAYVMQWMQHSFWGVVAYMGSFFVVYFMIWAGIYCSIWFKLRRINTKMKEQGII